MNPNRRTLLTAVIAVLVAALAYPPFQYGGSSGRAFNAGYGWIFDPPIHGRASVNIPMLIAEWIAVLVIGGLVWIALGDTPKSSETGSTREATPPETSRARTHWVGLALRLRGLFGRGVRTGIAKAALILALLVYWAYAAWVCRQMLRPWGTDDRAASQYATVAAVLELAIAAPFLIGLRRTYRSEGGKLGALILAMTTLLVVLVFAFLVA